MRFLIRSFDERLKCRFQLNPMTPCLADLVHVDFWLWCSIKSRAYGRIPSSLTELKDAIRHEISCKVKFLLETDMNISCYKHIYMQINVIFHKFCDLNVEAISVNKNFQVFFCTLKGLPA